MRRIYVSGQRFLIERRLRRRIEANETQPKRSSEKIFTLCAVYIFSLLPSFLVHSAPLCKDKGDPFDDISRVNIDSAELSPWEIASCRFGSDWGAFIAKDLLNSGIAPDQTLPIEDVHASSYERSKVRVGVSIKNLLPIPPAYRTIPKIVVEEAAFSPWQKSSCNFGNQWGGWTARDQLENGFRPACEDLLMPIGDEWTDIGFNPQFAETYQQCFAATYLNTLREAVTNTAIECSRTLAFEIRIRQQEQYDLCYVAIAHSLGTSVSETQFTFVEMPDPNSTLASGGYAIVPRESGKWDTIMDRLSGIVQQFDQSEIDDRGTRLKNYPVLKVACDIAVSDATLGKAPRNYFKP